jgi:hypothetical protein
MPWHEHEHEQEQEYEQEHEHEHEYEYEGGGMRRLVCAAGDSGLLRELLLHLYKSARARAQ